MHRLCFAANIAISERLSYAYQYLFPSQSLLYFLSRQRRHLETIRRRLIRRSCPSTSTSHPTAPTTSIINLREHPAFKPTIVLLLPLPLQRLLPLRIHQLQALHRRKRHTTRRATRAHCPHPNPTAPQPLPATRSEHRSATRTGILSEAAQRAGCPAGVGCSCAPALVILAEFGLGALVDLLRADAAVVLRTDHAEPLCAFARAVPDLALLSAERHPVLCFAQVRHRGCFFGFAGAAPAAFAGGFVVWGRERAGAFVGGWLGEFLEAGEAFVFEALAGGAVGGGVHTVDARGEEDFAGDDAHGLAFQVGGDTFDYGGVVEKALLTDADVSGEAGLGLFLGAEGGKVAGVGFGEAGKATGEVEKLGGGQGADEGGEIGREERHTGLDIGGKSGFGAVERERHSAGGEDGGEFGRGEGAPLGGGCFDSDNHEGGPVEDGLEGDTDRIGGGLREGFEVIHRPISDDSDSFGVVEGVADEGFEFGEAGRVMVADELVDEDDFVVDGGGEGVGLGEEVVFRVVFDRTYEGGLLFGREGLVMGDFLEVAMTGQGYFHGRCKP